jgi:hypothetical protein
MGINPPLVDFCLFYAVKRMKRAKGNGKTKKFLRVTFFIILRSIQ